MIKNILFELFGEGKISDTGHNYYHYDQDIFHIDLLEKDGFWLVSVDMKESFNKTSQSPIHFIYSEYEKFSNRKKKRIQSATNFLLTNRKSAGTYFGQLPGFDDLGEWVRGDFYKN
jgi:hypothetical protein